MALQVACGGLSVCGLLVGLDWIVARFLLWTAPGATLLIFLQVVRVKS